VVVIWKPLKGVWGIQICCIPKTRWLYAKTGRPLVVSLIKSLLDLCPHFESSLKVFEEFKSPTCLIVDGYSTRPGLKLSSHTCIIEKATSKAAAQFWKPLKGIEEFKSATCLIKGAYSTRQGVKLSTYACIIKKLLLNLRHNLESCLKVFEEFKSATSLIVGGYSTRQGVKLSSHACIIKKAASKSAAQFRKLPKGVWSIQICWMPHSRWL